MKVFLVSGLETQDQVKGIFSMAADTPMSGNASQAAQTFAASFVDDAERYPHVVVAPESTSFSHLRGQVIRFTAACRNRSKAFTTSGLLAQDFGALNGLSLTDARLRQNILAENFTPEGGESGRKAAARQERAVLRGLAFAKWKKKKNAIVWVLCPSDAFVRLSKLAGGPDMAVTDVAPMSVFEIGDGAAFAKKLIKSQVDRLTNKAPTVRKPASQTPAGAR